VEIFIPGASGKKDVGSFVTNLIPVFRVSTKPETVSDNSIFGFHISLSQ
jgi:hypothetical protein